MHKCSAYFIVIVHKFPQDHNSSFTKCVSEPKAHSQCWRSRLEWAVTALLSDVEPQFCVSIQRVTHRDSLQGGEVTCFGK